MFSKKCSYCEKIFYALKIDDFSKNFNKARLGLYGFTARCKTCRKKLESEKYKDIQKERKRLRKPLKEKTIKKNCQVCTKEFFTTEKRDNIYTCSEECSKFRSKVVNKLYHKNYYTKIQKEKRNSETKRANYRKPYSDKDVQFILNNIDMNISTIAKKLKRTTLSIRKKILNLKKAKYENTNK